MVVLDLLGRRTVLRIFWELRNGPLNFRALQDACETNSAHLSTRLRELQELVLVEHSKEGYQLTGEGRKLQEALLPLSQWATRWSRSGALRARMTEDSSD